MLQKGGLHVSSGNGDIWMLLGVLEVILLRQPGRKVHVVQHKRDDR